MLQFMQSQINSPEPKVKVVDGVLICCKEGHNKQIMMVDMEKETQISDRLQCSICSQNQIVQAKQLHIEQVMKQIQEKFEGLGSAVNQKQQYLSCLLEFKDSISSMQSKLIEQLEEIKLKTDLWIKDVQSLEIKHSVHTFIEDLKSLIYNQQDASQQILKTINKSHFLKVQRSFKILLAPDCFLDCLEKFEQIAHKLTNGKYQALQKSQKSKIKISEVNQSNMMSKIIEKVQPECQIQLIKSIKQKESFGAIAFNFQGNLLFTGCDNLIKVWKFENNDLVYLKTLQGHENQIFCLVFSKKSNWFVSGSSDSTIRCWQEKTKLNWVSSTQPGKHKEKIFCIVLNDKENELISCSFDKQIFVWKVNYDKNSLEFNYALEQKHTLWVYCISLNPSETALVSCGGDKMILLWVRGSTEKWVFKSQIVMDDFGFRLSFISDNQIVWLQQQAGILHVLENQKGNLILKPNLKLELNSSSGDGRGLFPIIVVQKKEILILRYNRFVYLIKSKNEIGKLNIIGQPIDCGEKQSFGALNENSEDLLIGNNETNEFNYYKLIMQ